MESPVSAFTQVSLLWVTFLSAASKIQVDHYQDTFRGFRLPAVPRGPLTKREAVSAGGNVHPTRGVRLSATNSASAAGPEDTPGQSIANCGRDLITLIIFIIIRGTAIKGVHLPGFRSCLDPLVRGFGV
jgi:hypothetical protein